MTLVPASSHGSTFSGGTVTPTSDPGFAVSVPDSISQALAVLASDHGNSAQWIVDAAGNVSQSGTLGLGLSGNFRQLTVDGSSNTTQDVIQAKGSGNVPAGVNADGALYTTLGTAPADAQIFAVGRMVLWYDRTTGATALGIKGKDTGGTIYTGKLPLRGGAAGALPTIALVTATAAQVDTGSDRILVVPVTYNPGVATTATCKVELSPDNVTFSTLLTITQPVGTVFDGSIEPVTLLVPAAWYVKLTVVNATLGTGTYY